MSALVVAALIVMLALCLCVGQASEGFHGRNNRLWPHAQTGYYWNRRMWDRPPEE